MALSSEFIDFVERWKHKADSYSEQTDQDVFDHFFTLFVVFNRLYSEATFVLHRKKSLELKEDRFHDYKAATSYVLDYLSSNYYLHLLEDDNETKEALKTLSELIENCTFHIKLNMVTGAIQPAEDEKLFKSLVSKCKNTRATAILGALYSVRCNMFHGNKEFAPIQKTLLKPLICILQKTIDIIYNKLQTEIS